MDGEGAVDEGVTLESLPADVLYHVCSFLDGRELVAAASASSALSRVANDSHVWRALLRDTYGLGAQDQTPGTRAAASEASLWKRLYFVRRNQWDALRFRSASLQERLTLSAQWEAINLFRTLVDAELAGRVNDLIGDRNVLHIACSCGSVPLARMLIEEYKVGINTKSLALIDHSMGSLLSDLDHHTPLSFAVESGNEDAVRYLLQQGANAELHDCLICLIVASNTGSAKLAQLFLERLKPFRPGGGWLSWLLAQDNQDASSKMMEKAFLIAVERASLSSVEVLELLLSHMPDRVKKRATTALYRAVNANRTDSVALLLKQGVPANAAPGEWGPIHKAAIIGNLEIIKLLIQYGADAGAPVNGHSGENAHMIALRSHGKPDVVEFLRQAPSTTQKETQMIFNIAVTILAVILMATFWFTSM